MAEEKLSQTAATANPEAVEKLRAEHKRQADLLRKKATVETLQVERRYEEEINRAATRLSPDKLKSTPDPMGAPAVLLDNFLKAIENPVSPLPFLCPQLTDLVALVPKQLIVLAAHSGKGKSTVAASIAYSLWRQGKRVFFISNEEARDQVAYRMVQNELGIDVISALAKPHKYPLTEEQKVQIGVLLADLIPENGVRIVDITYGNDPKYVQSIDGLKMVWEREKPHTYDAIIFDYYQNVTEDTQSGAPDHVKVQAELSRFLGAQIEQDNHPPIILMAQVKAPSKDDEEHIENRLWGRKVIYQKATQVVEIITNKRQYQANWLVWKDRFFHRDMHSAVVGFDRDYGRYVDMDPGFVLKRAQWLADQAGQLSQIQPLEKS